MKPTSPGVQRAVRERVRGLLGLVPVAGHHLRSRVTNSPTSPAGRSSPSSSMIRTIVLKIGTPTDSAPDAGSTGACASNGTPCDGDVVSVSP